MTRLDGDGGFVGDWVYQFLMLTSLMLLLLLLLFAIYLHVIRLDRKVVTTMGNKTTFMLLLLLQTICCSSKVEAVNIYLTDAKGDQKQFLNFWISSCK